MIKIYILLLSVFIFPDGVDICDCAPVPHWQKATPREFEYVEDVFIGDVTIYNEKEFEIRVCEVFKGNLKSGQIIKGKNSSYCGPYVDKNGEWLLFGKYSNNFKVNDCGLSSNIAEPFTILPPPPPPNYKYDEKTFLKKWKVEIHEIMQEQISILRKMKE